MFPERLKALRKETGLTQKEIAKKLNITQPAYQQWESGKIKPSADTLDKFASFFHVTTDYLLGNSDVKNPEDGLSDVEILYRKNSKNMTPEQKEIFKKELLEFMEIRRKAFEEEEQ